MIRLHEVAQQIADTGTYHDGRYRIILCDNWTYADDDARRSEMNRQITREYTWTPYQFRGYERVHGEWVLRFAHKDVRHVVDSLMTAED